MAEAEHPSEGKLAKFADGGLSQAARAQIYQHVERCERCRATIKELSEPTDSSAKRHAGGRAPTLEAPPPDLVPGQLLGEYRVLELLGQGGMGVVYKGEHPIIGKRVAIKVVAREIARDADVVRRMIDEARAVNAVRHPHIVDIFAFGTLPDGRPYMVMELLEGQSLGDQVTERGRLSAEETLTVLSQVMGALEAAHQAGIIHRDLKPENIFVSPRPEGWRVTLLDFGLALRADAAQPRLTQPGLVVGTPAFMSPEQVRGGQHISDRTDVYSMGVVAWTMLVGHEPFKGASIVETMSRHLDAAAPPIRPLVPEVPEPVEALVLRMLAKDPALRPAAREVRRAVAELRQHSTAVSVETARREGTRGVLLAAAGLALAVGIGGGLFYALDREPAPLPLAVREPQPIPRPALPAPAPDPAPPPSAALADGGAAPRALTAAEIDAKLAATSEAEFARTYSCREIVTTSPVFDSMLGEWKVFEVRFGAAKVLIVSGNKKKAFKQHRALRDRIDRCKGTRDTVVLARSSQNHGWATKGNGPFFLGGIHTSADDVTVHAADEKTLR